MLNRRIIYFFLLFQILPPESKSTSPKTSFLIKLVNHTQAQSSRSLDRVHTPMEMSVGDFKCNYKCATANESAPKFVGRVQAGFTDQGTNDSLKDSEMEPQSPKTSIFNLFSDDDEGEEDQESDDGGENVKDDEDVSDDFNFFGPEEEEEIDEDKLEGTKDESFLKQYHRTPFRMHQFVFPLLLAYKLKFFTVIPLLLGTLVLLVGTTGVAGFFFALFAAALAIHSKSQEH